MIHELAYYDVSPRIVKEGELSTITIRPLGDHAAFTSGTTYIARFLPMENGREPLRDYDTREVTPDDDGCLRVSYVFTGEQEYQLRIYAPEDINVNEDTPAAQFYTPRAKIFHLYALAPDLYARRPYRGDFHAHTTRSDGSEAPAFVAANYRKNGFDFFAVTDHHRYTPSIECIKAYADAPIDLLIINGEEVHAPGNPIHNVHFGGSHSVNEIFDADPDKYRAEVEAIKAETPIPPGVNAFEYASCLWIYREIKKAGGLPIFCHPHWWCDVYHVPDKMSDALFASGEFEAFELLGGQEVYCNNVQLSFYMDQLAKGVNIPVVGSSDQHGTENGIWFTWLSTLVFSERLATGQIIDAVRNHYSVAAEKYPGESEYRVYGPYRMVKLAKFLLVYYFPLHDELCFEEGRQMKEYATGSKTAANQLAMLKGRAGAYLEHIWGGTK